MDNNFHSLEDDDDGVQSASCWDCCRIVCNIICCPPIPHRIVAKLAFQPPSSPAYEFRDGAAMTQELWVEDQMHPRNTSFVKFTSPIETHIIRDIQTRRGNTLCALYLEHPASRATLLYSHGNAVDLGLSAPFMAQLAMAIECSIFAYDYSGYGHSTGRAREANLYSDVDAAFRCLIERLGVQPHNIVLYGQSIGSVATVDLATKHPDVAGVVLHSPLSSGLRVLKPTLSCTMCCDPFKNIDKVGDIHAPVLIIHGTRDEVVHCSHGEQLHELCPGSHNPLWVEGAGHNDIEMYPSYVSRLLQFIDSLPALVS
eukprot:m.49926 g.49926  ORF g.49926 m.49926 type:complete len:313 (-) comp10876_c0_seq1:106-1044(-)